MRKPSALAWRWYALALLAGEAEPPPDPPAELITRLQESVGPPLAAAIFKQEGHAMTTARDVIQAAIRRARPGGNTAQDCATYAAIGWISSLARDDHEPAERVVAGIRETLDALDEALGRQRTYRDPTYGWHTDERA
jgi:hypothetical protein